MHDDQNEGAAEFDDRLKDEDEYLLVDTGEETANLEVEEDDEEPDEPVQDHRSLAARLQHVVRPKPPPPRSRRKGSQAVTKKRHVRPGGDLMVKKPGAGKGASEQLIDGWGKKMEEVEENDEPLDKGDSEDDEQDD